MDWLPHHSYRDCFLQLHKVHKLRSRTGSVMGLLILEDLNVSSSCLWVCMLQGSCKGLIKHQPGVIMSVHPLMQHIPLRVLRVRGCLHKIPFNIVITGHSIRWWQRFQILKHYQRKSLGLSNRLFSWVMSKCFLGWLHLSMEKFLRYGDHIWIPLTSVEFRISCFLVAMTEDVLWGYMCMQVLGL